MITLIQAFRLCDINEEMVYLRHKDAKSQFNYVCVWSEKIRKIVDMKKIKVLRAIPHFSYDGYEGQEFVIDGISLEELKKLEWR